MTSRRQETDASDEGYGEQFDVLSATELLQKAKADYRTKYEAKSMRERYADNHDYIKFKRGIHDAQNSDQTNAPPLPNASTWFPSEARKKNDVSASASRRSRTAAADGSIIEDDDDDDDIQIAGEIASLKCPLTLQTFKQPYSNNVCQHTFEKTALIEYFRTGAFQDMDETHGRRRQVPVGPKYIVCPETGCAAKLRLEDFYDDQMVLRKVKRAQAAALVENDDTTLHAGDDSDGHSEDGGFQEDDD